MTKEDYQFLAQLEGFYDMPFKTGVEKYDNFFDFNSGGYGKLKEELFDTIGKKIYYLQGLFKTNYLTDNILNFANSLPAIERVKKWVIEINQDKSEKEHKEKEVFGFTEEDIKNGKLIFFPVISIHILYRFPICSSIELNPHIVKYIQEYL